MPLPNNAATEQEATSPTITSSAYTGDPTSQAGSLLVSMNGTHQAARNARLYKCNHPTKSSGHKRAVDRVTGSRLRDSATRVEHPVVSPMPCVSSDTR